MCKSNIYCVLRLLQIHRANQSRRCFISLYWALILIVKDGQRVETNNEAQSK